MGNLYISANLQIRRDMAASLGVVEGIWLCYQECLGLDIPPDGSAAMATSVRQTYAIDTSMLSHEFRPFEKAQRNSLNTRGTSNADAAITNDGLAVPGSRKIVRSHKRRSVVHLRNRVV